MQSFPNPTHTHTHSVIVSLGVSLPVNASIQLLGQEPHRYSAQTYNLTPPGLDTHSLKTKCAFTAGVPACSSGTARGDPRGLKVHGELARLAGGLKNKASVKRGKHNEVIKLEFV